MVRDFLGRSWYFPTEVWSEFEFELLAPPVVSLDVAAVSALGEEEFELLAPPVVYLDVAAVSALGEEEWLDLEPLGRPRRRWTRVTELTSSPPRLLLICL